ncbi:unnamed protein product [Phyllotreta striolata]|uniref:Uncharacterized protein n=1 Tax=Phyllotreta striolata TaxID=444603 RepID=A0A9N9XRF3_PHYSR|nr:unnamed protein product [Phyllotreta striolata]
MSSNNDLRHKNKITTPLKIKLERLNLKVASKKGLFTEATKNAEPATPQAQIQFSQELKSVLNERNILTSKTRKRVFDALDELKKKDEDEKRLIKRERALLEVVNSEIKYVQQLETIIRYFLRPTEERKLLRNEDFQMVFGNIIQIYNINKELLEELEKNHNNVTKTLLKIAPFLKVYSIYACEFKNALNILKNARTLTPQFAKFVENQETRPEVQCKLSSLLITPIQRVPRYKLLLTHLLELTLPDENDHNDLTECLAKIEETVEHIDKVIQDQENMVRLVELQRCLKSGEPNIIKPGRTLIKEGVLSKMAAHNKPSEKLYTVLTNDILVFIKMKTAELKVDSMKCHSILPLGKCRVMEIPDKGCMKIICQDEELILYHDHLEQTKIWINMIADCINDYLDGKKTLRKESSSRRPAKRKNLIEYHEVGLSPGKPLKKRKIEASKGCLRDNQFAVTGRNAITRTPWECDNQIASTSTTSTSISAEVPPAQSREMFVFGRNQVDDTSFKFFKVFNGIGSSIKKMFNFKS